MSNNQKRSLPICHRIHNPKFLRPFLIAGSVIFFITAVDAEADGKMALKIFKKCTACHSIGTSAKNKIGPHLNSLNDRVAGSLENYNYSKAMSKAGTAGLIWNAKTLNIFLKKPRALVKGTRMSFIGLKNEEDRQTLITWLLARGAKKKEKAETRLLGASAAKLQGDPEYGQYLSGECVACHRLDAEANGIPSIINWPKENFIHALFEYKQKVRINPVMQTVASRLSNEEIAALAAYFANFKPY